MYLYTLGFAGRPVLYRASIAEMLVPYADPKQSSYHKNVFDLGEYGVGMLANSLELGCDCLGTIQYFDAHACDSRGRLVTIKNAICLHEEDFGILWKHTDWRKTDSEVRRSHARLAVVDRRHCGKLRLWILLVPLSGRRDPDGGQAHGNHEYDRAKTR